MIPPKHSGGSRVPASADQPDLHPDIQIDPGAIGSQSGNCTGNSQGETGPITQRQTPRTEGWSKRSRQCGLVGVEGHDFDRCFPNPVQDLNRIVTVAGETAENLA